jgi:DNA-binding LacI/PurR family transcriptional regulator
MKSNYQVDVLENIRERRVNLRDIARELNVSHATVSLALRNHPRISKATKERVKQKAREMGYAPPSLLFGSSYYRPTSNSCNSLAKLAWINPSEISDAQHPTEEYKLYWEGALDVAQRRGYTLEEFVIEPRSLRQMKPILKARNILGVIVAPTQREVTFTHWLDLPVVCLGHNQPSSSVSSVKRSDVSNVILAYEKTLELGYQRIGFVSQGDAGRRFSVGYQGMQYAKPTHARIPPLSLNDVGDAKIKIILADWMTQNKPDAILTDLGWLPSMLEDLGYSIPGDVGLVSMNIHDTPINAGINPQPVEIGRAAIRLLALLIKEHQCGIRPVEIATSIEGHWVDGSMLPVRA